MCGLRNANLALKGVQVIIITVRFLATYNLL